MAFDSIRLPPDGAGKRVHTQKTLELAYDGGTLSGFQVNDQVFGKTSGASGIVSRISAGATSVAGTLHIILDYDSVAFQNDEGLAIGLAGNPASALANGTGTEGQVQQVMLVGGNNHTYPQSVDVLGAAFVRFSEGSPEFDVFGNQKVSMGQILGTYHHQHTDLTNTTSTGFEETIVGAASGTYDKNAVSYRASVTNASGDLIRRATNRYHHYVPGQGQLIELTTFTGDSGKANNVRRWGYFDDNDGYFFCLSGSNFGLVRRTSTSGTPVDTFISQSVFNNDVVDGTNGIANPSDFNIDLTKLNLYWIDIGWLGAGPATMGGYTSGGKRIAFHVFENPNIFSAPHIKTAVLPVAYENENVGGTSGTSELSLVCAAVKTEGPNRHEDHFPHIPDTYIVSPVTASIGAETILAGITAASTYKGQTNRIPVLPEHVGIFADQPTRINIYQTFAPTGAVFQQVNDESMADIDTSATDLGTIGVTKFLKLSKVVHAGEEVVLDVDSIFSPYSRYLTRTATGGTGSMVYMTAQPMSTATTSSIIEATITWNNGFFS